MSGTRPRSLVRVAGLGALAGALVAAPFFLYSPVLMEGFCLALFASAFDLLFGHAGLLSFGHAAFFGCGAYVTAWLVKVAGASPLLALPASGIAAALLGGIVGALAVRRSGIYLAMITMALAEIVYFLVLHAPFSGGEDGLQGVPRGTLAGLVDLAQPLPMYFFVLAVFLAGIALIHRIVHSPFGAVLRAIRENEERAVSLGYDVARYKVLAFVLSGGIAGVAGGLKALVLHFAALGDVYWHTSGEVIIMALLGGSGTLLGPSVGAFLVVLLSDSLAGLGEWVNFILGAIFVLCVLLFRRGLVGEALAWRRGGRRQQRRAHVRSPLEAEPVR